MYFIGKNAGAVIKSAPFSRSRNIVNSYRVRVLIGNLQPPVFRIRSALDDASSSTDISRSEHDVCWGRLSKLLSKMFSADMSLEKLANATVKNRVEYSQLVTQLNRIEKEKQLEMRMLNTEKQRFKAKYWKSNVIPNNQASDVKMFETHTPGFCFRRNGEQRTPQAVSSTPSVDFDHLQFLLFTDGEVDIDKVLCLHLLSSHETKHLAPPRRLGGSFTKKDSPLEQLIERSAEKPAEPASSSPLPTYILDVSRQSVHRQLAEDERLASRLIVNEKLTELITTVMTTLERTNPEKVRDLVEVAGDAGALKRIFRKPHVQEFVTLLKDNSLVHSCSSFVLGQPGGTASRLEIRTPSGALEDLVRFIRSNVLQFRTRSSFGLPEQESRAPVVVDGPARRGGEARRPTPTSPAKARREPPRVEEIEVEINPFRRQVKNFIARNIEAVAKVRQAEEEAPAKRPRRVSTEPRRPSVARERRPSQYSQSSARPRQGSDQVRVHSKQTTCPACMERWRIPLPAPKVSRVSKTAESSAHSMEREGSDQLLKAATNVQQRISMLIHKEQFKLASYDRKYSNASSVSRGGGGGRRRSSAVADSVDRMDLNVLDLEKIRQEIREKETKKKLEKFLGD